MFDHVHGPRAQTYPSNVQNPSFPSFSKSLMEEMVNKLGPNLLEIYLHQSAQASEMMMGKNVSSPILSEEGVPTINNLALITKIYANSPSSRMTAQTILDKMLEIPRLKSWECTTEELREEAVSQVRAVMKEGLVTIEQLSTNFDNPEVLDFLKKMAFLSASSLTLLGVHAFLYGLSITGLGTEKHSEEYLEKSNHLEYFGCCLMTELTHGSNVPGLETTATYDPKTKEFILHTPTLGAKKVWIGGAATNATHGVVFANLILNDVEMGRHAFIIQLRENGVVKPGIEIFDMGDKQGLNGVDNGCVSFDQVRLPKASFLNRFAEITDEGEYIPKEGNKNSHTLIFCLMSQFVRGRQIIALNAGNSLGVLSAIFACYPPLIGKSYHKRLLVGFLSKAFAAEFAKPVYLGEYVDDHIRASLMKAILSQMGLDFFTHILNIYGGSIHTLAIAKLIMSVKNDYKVTLTYEGDNTVLLQLAAKSIIKTILAEGQESESSAENHLNDPVHLMEQRVLELVNPIKEKLLSCGSLEEGLIKWNTECQIDGIEMSKIYAQLLILREFKKKSQELDVEQKTTKWKKLYEIYSWETCCQYIKTIPIPDLRDQYASLAEEVYGFLENFDLKMEWMHAMIPPPSHSFPYETTEYPNLVVKAAL